MSLGLALATGLGDGVQQTVLTGSMLLALPLAVLAGMVSFASPCVLPLVPGYLGFVTGMAGSGVGGPSRLAQVARSRMLIAVALFIGGFTLVFVSLGVLAGSLGASLVRYSDPITRVLGVVVVLMGLAFAGWVPFAQRERRFHVSPRAGVWGAPLLGVVFGLGWTPCIGPTLVAVYTLALDQASAGRGAILSVAYSLGLGLPFLLIALGLDRSTRALGLLRRHAVAIMRFGGIVLVVIGLALVTGLWSTWTQAIQGLIGGFETVV